MNTDLTKNIGHVMFYKEIPREIDLASKFLATSGDFWQFLTKLEMSELK